MKKLLVLTLSVFFLAITVQAQSKYYICSAYNETQPVSGGYGLGVGENKEEAAISFLEFIKKDHPEATKASCHSLPTYGSASDVKNKKWGLQGAKDRYLIFTDNQVLYIHECSDDRKTVQKFDFESLNEKSFKLTEIGIEGSCDYATTSGFKTDSIISVDRVLLYEDAPAELSLGHKRPNENGSPVSFYTEITK